MKLTRQSRVAQESGQTFLHSVKEIWAELSPVNNLKLFNRSPRADVLAGITVAIISIPMALAFGVASGLGAEAGVWGTICGGIFVGIFGGSTTGISGPTSPKVVQLAMVMKEHVLADGSPDLTFAFTMVALSGLILLVFAFSRVGRFIYYTPYSVVSGFMCGIGLILILLQINPMLGLPGADSLAAAITDLPKSLPLTNPGALIIALASFAGYLIWERSKVLPWIPSPLVGLAIGISLGQLLPFNVTFLHMDTGLPTFYTPKWTHLSEMIGPALALAGLCLFDSLLTCLVADTMTTDRHNSNRELFGQGIANIACGLIGGVTTATATMRTVTNIKSGARSGLACVVMGITMLGFMLGLARFADMIPLSCLAGILVKIGLDILDYRVIPVFQNLPRADRLIFCTVLFLTIFADLLIAVGVGLMIAFIHFIGQVSELYGPRFQPKNSSLEPSKGDQDPSSMVLSLEGPMFFGLSDSIYQAMDQIPKTRTLEVKLDRVNYMDLSGAYLLEDLVSRAVDHQVTVSISGTNPTLTQMIQRLNILRDSKTHQWEKRDEGGYKVVYHRGPH